MAPVCCTSSASSTLTGGSCGSGGDGGGAEGTSSLSDGCRLAKGEPGDGRSSPLASLTAPRDETLLTPVKLELKEGRSRRGCALAGEGCSEEATGSRLEEGAGGRGPGGGGGGPGMGGALRQRRPSRTEISSRRWGGSGAQKGSAKGKVQSGPEGEPRAASSPPRPLKTPLCAVGRPQPAGRDSYL